MGPRRPTLLNYDIKLGIIPHHIQGKRLVRRAQCLGQIRDRLGQLAIDAHDNIALAQTGIPCRAALIKASD